MIADGIAGLAARASADGGGRPRSARRGGRPGRMAGAAAGPHRRRLHGPAAGGHAGLHAGQPALFRAAHRGRHRRAVCSPSSPTSSAEDGGAAIIAGNERVLRARFADARHFWDLDRKTQLESRVPALDKVTFHAKLGSQGDRVRRLRRLGRDDRAAASAPSRARPTRGRAGEGRPGHRHGRRVSRTARRHGPLLRAARRRDAAVADAIRDHYAPSGPTDAVPAAPVSHRGGAGRQARQLVGFFAIGERPTGSGDPYALRRAALGVIRIIRENGLRLHLRRCLAGAGANPRQRRPGTRP